MVHMLQHIFIVRDRKITTKKIPNVKNDLEMSAEITSDFYFSFQAFLHFPNFLK